MDYLEDFLKMAFLYTLAISSFLTLVGYAIYNLVTGNVI